MLADSQHAVPNDGAPLVSVVIPTGNRAPMLRLTLETVLAQDLPGGDFEVLVTGDACTDDTASVVASFADPRLIGHILAERSGRNRARTIPRTRRHRRQRGA